MIRFIVQVLCAIGVGSVIVPPDQPWLGFFVGFVTATVVGALWDARTNE